MMESFSFEEEKTIRQKKKRNQLKIGYLEILIIFFKIMIKQQELVLFGVTIILNMKVTVIEKKTICWKMF